MKLTRSTKEMILDSAASSQMSNMYKPGCTILELVPLLVFRSRDCVYYDF